MVAAFARLGWEWGGTWVSSQDFQHVAAGDDRWGAAGDDR
ncbi:M15 family metallopeptidase [Nocardioides sp. P5_C9_2]